MLKEVEVNRSLMKNESFKNTQKELSNSEKENIYMYQFSSVAELKYRKYRTRGSPLFHYLPEFAQSHIHGISDAI